MTTTLAFELGLGPKIFYKDSENYTMKGIRHEKDHVREVYVDFENGLKLSLGFISVMHDYMTGKRGAVFLCDPDGGCLVESQGMYPSNKAALRAASEWLVNWLSIPFNARSIGVEVSDEV